jgi:adenine-specific DNA-methyltransferase
MPQENSPLTTELPERFNLATDPPADGRLTALRQLFPEVVREDKIDFDTLHRSLGDWIDPGPERFGLTWPGKAECMRIIQEPSIGTLVPILNESVDWDKTQNVIIEGENLEVLKLLQKAYYGKVKLIYIDPPYNTGNEFIYPDNFKEGLTDYLRYSGQVDEEGFKLTANTETSGRYHSKWLSMLYPRLFLARNLLAEDGTIFVSIDDHEVHNLRALMNEIFGEENFLGMITRSTGTPTGGGFEGFVNLVDYMLVYGRNSAAVSLAGTAFTPEDEAIYNQSDDGGRYLTRSLRRTGGADRHEDRPSMFYGIPGPDGVEVFPIGPGGYESRWRCGPDRYRKLERDGLIEWKQIDDGSGPGWKPYQKFYLEGRTKQPSNLWVDVEGNKKGTRELRKLFDDEKVFDSQSR